MATHPKSYLTPEQYLEIERKAEFKSEYYQGEMFAMSGAREGHNLIVWNLAAELHRQLRAKPCRAYINDMRVRVNATGLYTYPDVAAVCGEPQFLDENRDTLLNPSLIVEVLSPSTEIYTLSLHDALPISFSYKSARERCAPTDCRSSESSMWAAAVSSQRPSGWRVYNSALTRSEDTNKYSLTDSTER